MVAHNAVVSEQKIYLSRKAATNEWKLRQRMVNCCEGSEAGFCCDNFDKALDKTNTTH